MIGPTLKHIALMAALAAVPAAPARAQDLGPFDMLIQGGRILDGTGNPWFRADVGIRDGDGSDLALSAAWP